MILVLKRGSDIRILRGISMVTRRVSVSGEKCLLLHHQDGGGSAFGEDYIRTYDSIVGVASNGIDKLLWILRPVLKDWTPVEMDPSRFIDPDEWRKSDG